MGEIPPIQGSPGGRAMLPEDLLAIRGYVSKQVSPDGKAVALAIQRRVAGSDAGDVVGPNHRSETWIVLRDGRERRRITPPTPIRLSQWNPIWSPDSERLAFLSSEAQENVFPEVWDRSTGHIRRLATDGVDMDAQISRGRAGANSNQLMWIDDCHLLVVLLPEGLHSHSIGDNSRSLAIASDGVSEALKGQQPTAVVVSSPPDFTRMPALPQAKLVVFDTRTGARTVVGEMPAWQARMASRDVIVSPNGQWAGVISSIPADSINLQTRWSFHDMLRGRLGVVRLSYPSGGIRWVNGFSPDYLSAMAKVELSWKTDNSKFAVLGQAVGNTKDVSIAGVEPSTAHWKQIAVLDDHQLLGDGLPIEREVVTITQIGWLRDDQVAVRVRNPHATEDALRYEWWVVSSEGAIPLASEDLLLKDETPAEENVAVKLQTSKTGRLLLTDASGREEAIFPELNPQLAQIEEPRFIQFEYTSALGDKLQADLLLPHGYVPGTRYPTVVWVYGGDIHSGTAPPATRDKGDMFNLMVLAGHGYAVLIPSMPLSPQGTAGDPMVHLNDGVDPAVDRAIALGIVDANRLALMGVSYGGYSVFGLLTQTHRYRAGIGMMGVSDLDMLYGGFDPRFRYDDPVWAAMVAPSIDEMAQGRMGGPLWADPQRYMRNSPALFADRITTPLLIIEGDLDYYPLQSEQMFTVLNRQGKRAEFVRYLGEAHALESPANIVDFWQRTFAWLDTYVKNPTANGK